MKVQINSGLSLWLDEKWGSGHGLRKRGYAVIRERIVAGGSVYRISDAPAEGGVQTVLPRDAVGGREPEQKAIQTA